jgi:hypothetical protein
MTDFVGCKAALFCGDALLTYLRDDKPGLPWAAKWDLPGGGREGSETPEACCGGGAGRRCRMQAAVRISLPVASPPLKSRQSGLAKKANIGK